MTDYQLDVASLITLFAGIAGLLSSIGILLKTKSDINKTISETNRQNAEASKLEKDGRKVEVEVAEKFISSAGELIGTYKDVLDNFTSKYENLELKLLKLQEGLELEIGRRKNIERITLEIYKGVKILLAQQEELNITPRWKPEKRLEKELNRLEDIRIGGE